MTEALGRAAAVIDGFERLDGRFLLAALLLQLCNLGFRAAAWRNVLAAAYPGRRISFLSVGGAYAAGVAINAFTPGRAGELAKAALIRARIPGSALPTIVATLSVILVFDALLGATLVATLWGLGFLPALPSVPSPGAAGVGAAALLTVAVVVLRRRPAFLRRIAAQALDGLAVLRVPARYLGTVVPFQLAAWSCRIGVVMLVLAAFRIEASVAAATLVVVAGGVATAVPVPGGIGTQQVLVAFALRSTASVASAVSFSIGMQLGVTLVNTLIGMTALMLMLRTMRPVAALRSGLATVRATRTG